MNLNQYKSLPIDMSIVNGADIWLPHLLMLIEKFSYLGANTDLASLSIDDAWGLYCNLSRLEVSNGTKP